MNAETFCEHFATFADAPDGIKKLRHLILQLAVQGKLTTSETSDGSVTVLRREMESARQRMIDAGTIRQGDRFEPVSVDEVPYSLPANWTWVRIGEVMHLINGKAFKPTDWLTSGLPIVRIQNLNNPDAPFNYAGEDVDDKVRLQNDDFLISWSGTPGTSFGAFIWDRGPAVLNQHIFRSILYGEAFIKPFLKLAVNARLDEMIAQAHGGVGLQHITKGKLERLSLPLPPLAEQRRIVEKVDQLLGLCDQLAARQAAQREKRQRLVGATLDRLVSTPNPAEFPTHAHRLRNHFDQLFDTPTTIPQLRQTILQLAVQGQLVPQDPNDEPADALLANVHQRRRELVAEGTLAAIPKPVPLTEGEVETTIPKHWRWARLNDLVSIMDSGWSPACDEEPTTDESEWGVLKTTAVQTLYFNQGAHKRLPSGLQPRPEAEAKAGDLLITRAGPQNRVGISCLVKAVRPRLMISDKIIRFHLIEPFLFEEFIALCLNAGPSQAHIERAKSGMAASQMNISQAKFRMTPIPIPPFAEQKRIVTKVTELLSLCDALDAKLTQAESASTQLLSAAVHSLLQN